MGKTHEVRLLPVRFMGTLQCVVQDIDTVKEGKVTRFTRVTCAHSTGTMRSVS